MPLPRLTAIVPFAILLVAGCSGGGMERTVLPVRIDYQCANQRVLKIKRLPEQQQVAVLVGEATVLLPRVDSAAQEKYSDGRYTLYLQGERAALEDNGRVLYARCQAGPLPKEITDGFSR